MVDTDKLRKAVDSFAFSAKPSNRNLNRPCTAEELEKAINEIAKLMNKFINELENQ